LHLVGLVCGYGTDIDDRLRSYVGAVADWVRTAQPDALILSGGLTGGRCVPSEAAILASLLSAVIPGTRLVLEERAYTTLHNLLYAHHTLTQLDGEDMEVVIFCDYARALKVALLTPVIFRSYKTRIMPIARPEPLRTYIMQVPSTFLQVIAAFFPSIAAWLERRRRARVDVDSGTDDE
jgi:hypothetical protein